MKNTQENQITSLHGLGGYIEMNLSRTTAVPGIAMEKKEFSLKLKAIDEIVLKLKTVSEGKTAVKLTAQELLQTGMTKTKSLLSAWATKTKDAELKKKMDYTMSDFKKLRQQDLKHTADALSLELGNVSDVLPDVHPPDYGLTDEYKANFSKLISNYETSLKTRTVSVNQRVDSHDELAVALQQTEEFLTEIKDNLFENFVDTDPSLYNGYKLARETKNPGVRHNKPDPIPPNPAPDPNPEK